MYVASHSARLPETRQVPSFPGGFYRRLPESALADLRLSRSALAVLAQLDGFARDKAECWPSIKTLAQALGLCRRTIQLALARLKACGYVAEREASNPTGRMLVLLWRTGAQASPSPGAQPYSQGLPVGGRKPARSNQSQFGEGKERARFASPDPRIPEQLPVSRPVEPRPTAAERTETLRKWLEAVPVGSPLARLLAERLKV